jgi:hypothetical protein
LFFGFPGAQNPPPPPPPPPSPPRIEPEMGPDRRDNEYQFSVRLAGERYGVSLLVAASAPPGPADGVVRCWLDDAAAVRQILRIHERSASKESTFAYVCAFSRGMLLAIAGSDDRRGIEGYVVSCPRQALLAAGIPAEEIPSADDGSIDIAGLSVTTRGTGNMSFPRVHGEPREC